MPLPSCVDLLLLNTQITSYNLSPTQLGHSSSLTQSHQSQLHSHSRMQSQSQSHHLFPGTPAGMAGHAHSHSKQSSFGSPVVGGFGGQQQSGQVQDSLVNFSDGLKAPGPAGVDNGAVVGIAMGMPAAAGPSWGWTRDCVVAEGCTFCRTSVITKALAKTGTVFFDVVD
jgi:hypothetical protein